MSKRHRKTKAMLNLNVSGTYGDGFSPIQFDVPLGPKIKGKHRRRHVKPAYYDD